MPPTNTPPPVPPTTSTNAPADTGTSAVMSALEKRLLQGSGAVSSSNSGIETAISQAVAGVQQSGQAAATRINSDANRQATNIGTQFGQQVQDFTETRVGFGTPLAAMRKLVGDTDKQYADLEKIKQDALLQNDANTVEKISGLQMKALEFKQQQEQQFYSNLFQFAGVKAQQDAQAQAKQQFTDKMQFDTMQRTMDRQDKMAGFAAQYGVELSANDTYETLMTKVSAVVKSDKAKEEAYRQASLAMKADKKATEAGVYDNLIGEVISSGGTPEAAVNSVLSFLQKSGNTLTREEANGLLAQAQSMKANYDKVHAQAKAESSGGILSYLFGGGDSKPTTNWYSAGGILSQPDAQKLNKNIVDKQNADAAMNPDNLVIESPQSYKKRMFGL